MGKPSSKTAPRAQGTGGAVTMPAAAEAAEVDDPVGHVDKAEVELVALRVRCIGPRDTLRRAGRVFGREVTRVPLAELSDAQIEALYAEPLLDVVAEAEPEAETQS